MDGIAIIGMSGRFPGAASVSEFWQNLVNGVESISRFADAELELPPPPDAGDGFVPARGIVADADQFDPAFFGYQQREAEQLDPQGRLLLECAWEALEIAGYDPASFPGLIGVWAGATMNSYLLYNQCPTRADIERLVSSYQQGDPAAFLGNEKDFIATRLSYKLNLRGPSLTVQTACSTGLVAVAQACQALLGYQTDLALAGGVALSFPQRRGYVYQEGAIASADGHNRTFDADARGTVFGNGAGLVLLKRAAEAIADGDEIYAVIRGAAVNNDGAAKVSYTAPSVDGQAEAILQAQAMAGVAPESISYVEAHGTATPLGDPIEVAALTQAFRAGGATGKNFCALGSVKGNIGHLEMAAGVAALIKTALALKHRQIPASLHFVKPNPKLSLEDSPFFVNDRLRAWESPSGEPRRAGVSSFGVGGTNAHVVLEEAPAPEPARPSARGSQLLVLSTRTETALATASRNLAAYLRANPALDLADAAFTLQAGRRAFAHRRAIVCADASEAIRLLEQPDKGVPAHGAPSVVFLFAGQGAQAVNMGAGLYRSEAVFRDEIDRCAALLEPALGADLRTILYPAPGEEAAAAARLDQTRYTQPALFTFGYALAKLWLSWGIVPQAMLGHSVGEYVAACLAGVFSLEDALRLVAERARMVQAQPPGAMLAARLPEAELRALLPQAGAGLSIAAVNAPNLCVAAGPAPDIAALEKILETQRTPARRLRTSHAFHSAMVEPVVGPFTALLQTITLRPPQIPLVSNVTGQPITDAQATDPHYWGRHLREAVRFAEGVGALLADHPNRILLEVGPGQMLTPLARQHPAAKTALVLGSLQESKPDDATILAALARLWASGAEVDWTAFQSTARRRRVPLPTYPFERKRCWIEAPPPSDNGCHPERSVAQSKAESARQPKANLPAGSSLAQRSGGASLTKGVLPPAAEGPSTALVPRPAQDDKHLSGIAVSAPAPMKEETPPPAVSRLPVIVARMKTTLKNLSGQDQSAADPDVSFLELGFDSLFLTQVAQALRKEFNVKVTFRQLLEDYPTMGSLAAYLDAQLPPEPAPMPKPSLVAPPATVPTSVPVQAAPSPAPAAALPVSASGTTIERIIQEQLRVMAQQLETLRGGSAAYAPAALPDSMQPAPAAAIAPPEAYAPSASQTALPSIEPKPFGPYRPIDKGPGGGFTERQQQALDGLVARYTARTPNSKRQTQETRAHFADPRTVSGFRTFWKEMVYPIVVNRSAGSRFWDIDGNEYVDVTMGFGTNLFGHSPAFVTEAIEAQLKKGIEVGPQSTLAGKVAALLCELSGTERAAFTNTGSEAVLAAVRLARTVSGRTRIATCGGFHGINDEVLVRGMTVDGQRRGAPVAPGIPDHIVRDVVVADYGTPEGLEHIRAHAHELACVLVEPVQSRRPDLQPREFLHELRRITQEAGVALVFDEIITGFRCDQGGAQAHFGVKADMVTYGKVIGGGMPVGAICGKAEYLDALDGGAWQYGDGSFPEVGVTFFAGTYIRHPLTIAASWAVLNHLKREGPQLQRTLNARATRLFDELNEWFASSGVPLRLEHFSSWFYPRFDEEIKYGSLLYFCLRERGVHIWEGRPAFLSTAHTEEDVEFVIRAFKDSVRELQEGGFLPGEALREQGRDEHPRSSLTRLERPAQVDQPETNGTSGTLIPTLGNERASGAKPVAFSLYFFGNYPPEPSADKYRLILEGAKFADQHGFSTVWLPERHFHSVGGFSPNPSVMAAALARETTRIRLHGGSVVLPLHHPVRVAEEWALVDNLSNGRTGLSVASGWHPNDFVFAPQRFERRREICSEDIQTIRRLWRGETLTMPAGAGADFGVKLHPLPVQPDLPVWLTCIQEESYARAGELGVGVLGYLMNQTVDEAAAKIARYREAFIRAGHDPAKAHVTLLVHTFLGNDASTAREQARGPLTEYLRSYLDNSQKRLESQNGSADVAAEDVEYLLERSFNDYASGKALIGSPESCAAVVDRLRAIGVDEIGCFIDFGVDTETALAALPALDRLRQQYDGINHRGHREHREEEERSLPFTEAQAGLWVLGQTDPDALRTYNETAVLDFRGALDVEALRRALQGVVDSHEALRTTVVADGETQIIHAAMPLDVPLQDAADALLPEIYAEIERTEFDFARGPVLRARVIRLAEDHHLLALTFHHLLGNGPSYWAFFEDLTALYDAERMGRPAELEPAMQLSEFVQWRTEEAARNQAEDEAFWTAQFSGGPAALELPADRPRPSRRSHRGARQSLVVGRELTSALRRMAAARRGSLFMALLAAFETLLHRLSGQDDVTVGVPYEGEARTLPGGGRLFANTTNVMPLRSRAGEDASFADLFAATKNLVFEATERQNYFFGRLLKKLGIAPDPSRPPLFSAFFNYESGKFQRTLDGGALRLELLSDRSAPYRSPSDTAMFELYLNVAEKDGELHCECDHSTDLFDGKTVSRWLGHYRTLLAAIAAPGGAETRLWELPLLDADERQTLVVDWNRTEADYPLQTPLHELIDAQARRTPDAPALVFENETLTYAQLNARANQLANHLRGRGVGRGDLVGVCLERSFEMVVGLLGILKAGAAYVPLDPDYPAERLAFMAVDTQARVLLTQARHAAKLPADGAAAVIRLDADWNVIARESAEAPAVGSAADDPAYVIYTSGSTGQPKGVVNLHRNICNRLHWKQAAYPLTGQDRLMLKTPFTFDVSVPEFFAPLLAGAVVVIARPGGHMDSDYLARLVEEQRVTDIHFVPPMLAVFLEEHDLPRRCATLRRVNCSGEALPGELVGRFFETFGDGVQLLNLYGPTEAAVEVTFHECRPEDATRGVPIGRLIANTQAYLLDAHGQPVPVGVPGELHLGGANVAWGYLNRPELTAEKFIADPFRAGGRLYKTGDLTRWQPDGSIAYLGRMDGQVKVRGFRIELEEIEARLCQHPAVRESVVVVREDRPGDRRLAAYFVADGAHELAATAELRAYLKERLPDYMVPAAFVRLDALPLTANGKVNRRALPAPEFGGETTAAGGVAEPPRTALESQLIDLWRPLLGVERIGPHDNFFELGGDSLLGLRMVNQLRERHGAHLSLVTVFEAPTVAALAALLEKQAAAAKAKPEDTPAPAIHAPLPSLTAVSREARRVKRSTLAAE